MSTEATMRVLKLNSLVNQARGVFRKERDPAHPKIDGIEARINSGQFEDMDRMSIAELKRSPSSNHYYIQLV